MSSPHPLVYILMVVLICVAFLVTCFIRPSYGRDLGQWENTDPEISAWYRSLKQPDSPLSCCGEADSYYCSEHARGAQVYCIVDDERDDATLKRMHVENGTEIKIPTHKINKDANKIGRAIVFLSSGGDV